MLTTSPKKSKHLQHYTRLNPYRYITIQIENADVAPFK